jgi:hypothetical protein
MTPFRRLFFVLPICAGFGLPLPARADPIPLFQPPPPAAVPAAPAVPVPAPVAAPVSDPSPPSIIPCPTACAPCPVPCPTVRSAPSCKTPKIVVEMSQPEIRFVAAKSSGSCAPTCVPACAPAPAAAPCENHAQKSCSLFNLYLNRSRTKLMGGGAGGVGAMPQQVTTVVPAFATATVPIALQTTQFVSGSTEMAAFGARRESALVQAELADALRETVRRELARQESARAESAKAESAAAGPSCAELKTRVDQIEKRLEQIEKKVESIANKLNKLP